MISFKEIPNIYLVTGSTDLRKGIDGYAQIVQNHLNMKSMDSSAIYIFCNSNHDKLKCLYWDGNGFWLLYKRLEKGTFKWTKAKDGSIAVTQQQLSWLLEGLKMEQKTAFKPIKKGSFNV